MSESSPLSSKSDASPTNSVEMSQISQSSATAPSPSSSATPSLPSSNLFGSFNAPQDPFLPRWVAQGPVFLDTNACICALQSALHNTTSQVWECLGNATSNPYMSTSGKWFPTASGVGNVTAALNGASNPPLTDRPLVATNDTTLVPLASVNPNPLSIFDQACTGLNRTNFTTSYYRATDEIAKQETPVDGAPCFRPGAVPIPIAGVSSWQNETGFFGCKEGFFCKYFIAAQGSDLVAENLNNRSEQHDQHVTTILLSSRAVREGPTRRVTMSRKAHSEFSRYQSGHGAL